MANLIEANDNLNQGRSKLNTAITQAEQAINKSNISMINSNKALANSQSTQTQLDTIVIEGDSSVEAAQARVEEDGTVNNTLKDRLDKKDAELELQSAQLNKNALDIKSRGINVMFPPIPLMPPLGDADDSARIQAIIDLDLPVFVPPGIYKLNTRLALRDKDFKGSGTDTVFDLNGCDGFLLKISSGRKVSEICGFRVITSNNSCDNFSAFVSEQHATSRSIGYKIHHIEIGGGGRFGGGFDIYDMFRLELSNIGMTDVMNPIMLRGQVVQTILYDVTANCGSFLTSTYTSVNLNKKCGLFLDGSNHSGSYQMPESVKVIACSFVGYNHGVFQQDCLFSLYIGMDLDYCKMSGFTVVSASGGLNFLNSWVAMDGIQTCNGVHVQTPNFDPHPIIIDGVHVSFLNNNYPNSMGFNISDESNAGRLNVKVERCTVKGVANAVKHGFNFNRTKKFKCSDNVVFSGVATNEEININFGEAFSVKDNIADRIKIYSDGSYYEMSGNHTATYNLTGNSAKHFIKNGVVQA